MVAITSLVLERTRGALFLSASIASMTAYNCRERILLAQSKAAFYQIYLKWLTWGTVYNRIQISFLQFITFLFFRSLMKTYNWMLATTNSILLMFPKFHIYSSLPWQLMLWVSWLAVHLYTQWSIQILLIRHFTHCVGHWDPILMFFNRIYILNRRDKFLKKCFTCRHNFNNISYAPW